MSAAVLESARTRWERFCFDLPALPFFDSFAWVFYAYAVAIIWRPDWATYEALAKYLYAPVGLWSSLGLPWPGLAAIRAVQALGTLAAISAAAGVLFRPAAAACALTLLLLDAWSNGFGFINVQIHFIWFAVALCFCPLDRASRGAEGRGAAASLAFRFMELVTVLAYVQSGLAKLLQSGPAWALDGTTLQIGALRQGLPLGFILADHAALAQAGSAFSLLLELAFLLYYPLPALRYPLLTGAVVFHMSTLAFMGIGFMHLWVFSGFVLLFGRGLVRERSQ